MWAYCDGIRHASTHTPWAGVSHRYATLGIMWSSPNCATNFALMGKASGASHPETPYRSVVQRVGNPASRKDPLVVGGREMAMIAGGKQSSSRVARSHGSIAYNVPGSVILFSVLAWVRPPECSECSGSLRVRVRHGGQSLERQCTTRKL